MTRSRALIAGWLVVGFLDLLDAFLFFGLVYDVRPTRSIPAVWFARAAVRAKFPERSL